MPRSLTIISAGGPFDKTLLFLHAATWLGHIALATAILSTDWLAQDPERPLVLGWCILIITILPLGHLAMRRTRTLEATPDAILIRTTGFPCRTSHRIPRATPISLKLVTACWGAYDLLILDCGKMPWQQIHLAPLASTHVKKSIEKAVAEFLTENHVEFLSSEPVEQPALKQVEPKT